MKKTFLFMALMLLIGAQTAAVAQELTVSDFQNSGCLGSTRASNNEEAIVLTKEGTTLKVQLFNYWANCAAYNFSASASNGTNNGVYLVSINVGYDDGGATCMCPYNISFSLHGLEVNSFFLSCLWYNGLVDLTEGEPLVLGDTSGIVMKEASIDGFNYTLEDITLTATLKPGSYEQLEGDLNIPSEVSYEGQKYSVKYIGEYALAFCGGLTSVTIPRSVVSIGHAAFYGCSGLEDVYCFADNVPTTVRSAFQAIPLATATLHVPAASVEKYKATSPWNEFGSIEALPTEYFPEGTKWTEIRLDTLKYDSWYSKVGNEWVPNFETIEYYVKGEFVDAKFDVDNKFKCVYTNGPEWTDSLTLMILEDIRYEPNAVEVTVPLFRAYDGGSHLYVLPGRAYEFDWSIGQVLSFQMVLGRNATCWCYWYNYGVIDEIKEGYFGGVRPLKYVDLDGKAPVDPEERPDFEDTNGCRIIQGIGVTEWNSGECIFGPVDPYFGGIALAEGPDTGKEVVRHYRSMLVHFERDGEVLYDLWPEKIGTGISATLNDKGKMTNDSWYDLQGRKVSGKPARGIYIESGKKKVK